MSQLILLVCLDQDRNTLSDRIAYVDKVEKISLLKRDGVVLLGSNVLLFEQTKSHSVFVLLCASLLSARKPFLSVPLVSETAMLVGEIPKEVENIFLGSGIPLIPPL